MVAAGAIEGRAPAACAWCEAPLGAGAPSRPGGRLCRSCGAVTTDPWLEGEELEAAYGTWYRPAEGGRFSLFGDALLRATRRALAARIDQISPPGPILDVGAGEGVLIDALAARGREAHGIERDPRHPRVRDTDLSSLDPGWAAAVFWHALEHLPAPGKAIDDAARLLVADGRLIVAVPNLASWQARVFGPRWLHLDPPRHLVHLPVATLVAGLQQRGFVVDRISGLRGGQNAIGWLDGLVGSLPGRPSLYESLRAPAARSRALRPIERAVAIGAGIVLAPVALVFAGAEAVARRSGTVCVEARRA